MQNYGGAIRFPFKDGKGTVVLVELESASERPQAIDCAYVS